MEIFILTIIKTSLAFMLILLAMIMFWYNGVLEVHTDEDGDSLKLNINEYDMIRNRKIMLILIKRK